MLPFRLMTDKHHCTAAVRMLKPVEIPAWMGSLTLAKKDYEWLLRESHFCLFCPVAAGRLPMPYWRHAHRVNSNWVGW